MKVLSLILAILKVVSELLTLIREKKLKDEGRAELETEILEHSEAVRRDAEEIDRDVAAAPLDDLQQRMRKYQR